MQNNPGSPKIPSTVLCTFAICADVPRRTHSRSLYCRRHLRFSNGRLQETEPENMDQDIEEIAGLGDEILNSGISTDSIPVIHLPMAFMSAVRVHLREPFGGKVPSEKVIGYL